MSITRIEPSKNPPIFKAMFTPKLINAAETQKLRQGIYLFVQLHKFQNELESKGWKFYVVEQTRGACYYGPKIITIPLWALKKSQEYHVWYICHEMAHAYAGPAAKHGKDFMRELIRICPVECIHFEASYKPRNLIAAGAKFCPEALDF